MQNIAISKASAKDLKDIIDILESTKLPSLDIYLDRQTFWVARDSDALAGISAIESYSVYGIFRSFVVREHFRNRKLGSRRYKKAVEEAKKSGIHTLYLLTTSAEMFFQNKGWKRIERNRVPEEVLQSQEFVSICPQSAICMVLKL